MLDLLFDLLFDLVACVWQEDKDNFCNAVRNEVKGTGLLDTPENCWDFFISKVTAVALLAV